jgi:hypothetical protein
MHQIYPHSSKSAIYLYNWPYNLAAAFTLDDFKISDA